MTDHPCSLPNSKSAIPCLHPDNLQELIVRQSASEKIVEWKPVPSYDSKSYLDCLVEEILAIAHLYD
jgi:hypothetical protein